MLRTVEIEAALNHGHGIKGVHDLGGFAYDLTFSKPYIATAIHAGNAVGNAWEERMVLEPALRLMEEDAATDRMIAGCANTVAGLDSRAVYDLNRPSDLALPLTPERFWGVRVYGEAPGTEMNRQSLERYEAFYGFMKALVSAMLDRFGFLIVFDIHSYNILRQKDNGFDNPPVFNLGTSLLNRRRWGKAVETWLTLLGSIHIPGIETTVAENLVFQGKGEFCRRLSSWDPRILVLPTEVSKIYMDELSGDVYSSKVEAIRNGLVSAMDRMSESLTADFDKY